MRGEVVLVDGLGDEEDLGDDITSPPAPPRVQAGRDVVPVEMREVARDPSAARAAPQQDRCRDHRDP